jgi:hypothetical protein
MIMLIGCSYSRNDREMKGFLPLKIQKQNVICIGAQPKIYGYFHLHDARLSFSFSQSRRDLSKLRGIVCIHKLLQGKAEKQASDRPSCSFSIYHVITNRCVESSTVSTGHLSTLFLGQFAVQSEGPPDSMSGNWPYVNVAFKSAIQRGNLLAEGDFGARKQMTRASQTRNRLEMRQRKGAISHTSTQAYGVHGSVAWRCSQ